MNYIIDNIFIGNITDAQDDAFLKSLKINVSINCANDLEFECDTEIKENFDLIDGPAPQRNTLYQAINKLEDYVKDNRNILLYCHDGLGRSVIVVAGFLAKKHKVSIYRALDKISKRRKDIQPNKDLIWLAREVNNEV